MGFLHDDVLDAALDEIQTNVTTLTICNALPTTFAQANDDPGSAGYKLGTKSSPTVGSPQDGDTSGRKITISAISDGSVGYTGTASHWALISGTVLYAAYDLASTQGVSSGNTFTLTAFDIEIPDAPA